MKTILTMTFAIALMVFAFNTTSASANEGTYHCMGLPAWLGECDPDETAEIDELKDPDQKDSERDVADSGNEGSTSAASASDQ